MSFYGYKNHIKADKGTKPISDYIVTDASVHEKGNRYHKLTDAQKASNKEKSRTRARVEHVSCFRLHDQFDERHVHQNHWLHTGNSQDWISQLDLYHDALQTAEEERAQCFPAG